MMIMTVTESSDVWMCLLAAEVCLTITSSALKNGQWFQLTNYFHNPRSFPFLSCSCETFYLR